MAKPTHYSTLALNGYGLGSVGTALVNTVPSLLLLAYTVNILAIPPATAAIVVLIPKILVLLVDTLVGNLSDKTKALTGKRCHWLTAGSILIPLTFLALFALPPYVDQAARPLVLTVLFAASLTALSIFAVPYVAIAADLTDDYNERTRILSFRVAYMVIGIMVSGAAAPALIEYAGGGVAGYQTMSLIIAIFLAVILAVTTYAVFQIQPRLTGAKPEVLSLNIIKQALSNYYYSWLLFCYMVLIIGANCLLAAVPFYVQYLMQLNTGMIAVMFVAHMVPSIVTMPLWRQFSLRYGKLRGFQLSIAVYCIGALLLWLLAPSDQWLIVAAVAFMGVGFAGVQLFPFSMLPDAIDADVQHNKSHREGLYTGMWLAGEKIANALGMSLAGLILAYYGFKESHNGEIVEQTDLAVEGILISFALIPAIVMGIALLLAALFPKFMQQSLSYKPDHSYR